VKWEPSPVDEGDLARQANRIIDLLNVSQQHTASDCNDVRNRLVEASTNPDRTKNSRQSTAEIRRA
jgi:hypothetical protein